MHPPCTATAVSGARHFAAKQADARQPRALGFIAALWNAPIARKALELPVSIAHRALGHRADQIVQPWQFEHGETKGVCFWLAGLPPLVPTRIVDGREARVHHMPPSPTRARDRARTCPGIAAAMAEQWGGWLREHVT
jgi:hypothetical protein